MSVHGAESSPAPEFRHPAGLPAPATVRDQGLYPLMGARCHNLDQFDPSPECDSLAEHAESEIAKLKEIFGDGPFVRLEEIVEHWKTSNLAEGDGILSGTGMLDTLVRTLNDVAANGFQKEMSQRDLIKVLRADLGVLLDLTGSVREITEANLRVKDLIGRLPIEVLLKSRIEHELAGRKYRLLERMVNGEEVIA